MKILKFSILLIIVIVAVSYFSYKGAIDKPFKGSGENVVFTVESGDTVQTISRNLMKAGLIDSDFYFRIFAKQSGKQSKLQAGEYNLSPTMSISEIVEILARGKAVSDERTIKLIEGWNSKEISQYFETEGMFQSEELLELVGYPRVDYKYEKDMPKPFDYSDDFEFLRDKPDNYGLEGYLFPDTYRIFSNATLDDIVRKMLANLDKKLTQEMRDDIKAQGKTVYEIMTMASIIQKEVRSEDDMKMVSGIFWNRIEIGKPLESCATLAYILGVNKAQYTYEDTEIDSPYNAYKNYGLPPGPIANPGIEAIKAAIYPTESDYLFFLSSSDDGKTIFSKTYDEHLRNKAKYLK